MAGIERGRRRMSESDLTRAFKDELVAEIRELNAEPGAEPVGEAPAGKPTGTFGAWVKEQVRGGAVPAPEPEAESTPEEVAAAGQAIVERAGDRFDPGAGRRKQKQYLDALDRAKAQPQAQPVSRPDDQAGHHPAWDSPDALTEWAGGLTAEQLAAVSSAAIGEEAKRSFGDADWDEPEEDVSDEFPELYEGVDDGVDHGAETYDESEDYE